MGIRRVQASRNVSRNVGRVHGVLLRLEVVDGLRYILLRKELVKHRWFPLTTRLLAVPMGRAYSGQAVWPSSMRTFKSTYGRAPAFRTVTRALYNQRENLASPHQETSATAGGEGGQGADEQVNTNGEGGLGWLTNVAAGNSTPLAASARASTPSSAPAAKSESDDVQGDDWLTVAKSTGQTKRTSHNGPDTRSSVAAPSAAPGGWMSSGKLGAPTGNGSDENDTGRTGGGSTKKKKPTRRSSSSMGGAAGWLGSGALGVPTEDESDKDDVGAGSGGGGDGSRGVGVTIETQTEDDIEAVTKGGATESGNAPKLPPWAKPWVPSAEPKVVIDIPPEVTTAPTEEAGKKVTKLIYPPHQILNLQR